jgi:hypothetical protein
MKDEDEPKGKDALEDQGEGRVINGEVTSKKQDKV